MRTKQNIADMVIISGQGLSERMHHQIHAAKLEQKFSDRIRPS